MWMSGAAGRDILRDLWYVLTEHRRAMEITCGVAGGIDDAIDASDLLDSQPNDWRDFLWRELVVLGIETQVHAVVGEREVKLLL